MKIGIIGSGEVGRTLAKAFLAEGNEVMLGTRDTSKKEVVLCKQDNPTGKTGTFADTARFGDLLVLAVAGEAAEAAVNLAGTNNFSNKIVIDTTNPIDHKPPVNGVLACFTQPDKSLLEIIQQLIPDAKMVKAFNSVGSTLMYKPHLQGGKPTMFICGNDEAAKKTVTGILTT